MLELHDDPSAIHRNREIMHARWRACTDATAALTSCVSSWESSLDGDWAFQLSPSPSTVPVGAEHPSFDDSNWARIPVPSNWELHGHGEAIYQNIAYPFAPTTYPAAPTDNPTGTYRTTFIVSPDWKARRVFIEFGSVDSAFRFWINGTEVGFSTDSKLPAHFEISHLLIPGTNHLTVRVFRWPTSSHLEKQDYWHLSGIQRSVRLIAKPEVHLRDWMHRVAFDAQFKDATLTARAWINKPAGPLSVEDGGSIAFQAARGWSVSFSLHDNHGGVIASASAPVADSSPMYGPNSGGIQEALSAKVDLKVSQPDHWTAETPALYTLVMALHDPTGETVDWESTRVGFRQIAIVDGMIKLNGQRLVFRGVNRHEFHPLRGRAVTLDDMREDLLAMKRLNFNAVRTSHYPNADAWYDLCNDIGMYVIDEANLETHGMGALASLDPQWACAYMERALRMYLRDRNHPCIVSWSLGNESHVGPHHAAMANWLRFSDPGRPVQYESAFPGPLVTDIMAPMYPELDWVRTVLSDPNEKRPMVMCEYAYAKGNSTGNVGKFWDLVWKLPRFQGGFVWDWRDKPLWRDNRWQYGVSRWEPSETERMCLNGVVGPDLVEHPAAWELRHVMSPIQIVAEDLPSGRLLLTNRYQFLSLSGLRLHWSIEEDGVSIAEGDTACPGIEPGKIVSIQIELPQHSPAPGSELHLRLSVVQIHKTAWAQAGSTVDEVQFQLAVNRTSPRCRLVDMPDLLIEDDVFSGPDWRMRFDQASGTITSLKAAGSELLARPITPCLGRAPTDIDLATAGRGYAGQWTASGLDRATYQPISCQIFRINEKQAKITTHGSMAAPGLAPFARVEMSWMVYGSSDLIGDVMVLIDAPVETIPRIGLVTSVAGDDHQFQYFGRGPFENYPDRQTAALLGRYRASVAELLTAYIFPQECGLRTGVRWLAVTRPDGSGLFVQGSPHLCASALRVRMEDLQSANNLADLVPRHETSLHLDGFHMGLGGDTGWTKNVHPEFRLMPDGYRFRIRIKPITGSDDLTALGRSEIEGHMR